MVHSVVSVSHVKGESGKEGGEDVWFPGKECPDNKEEVTEELI